MFNLWDGLQNLVTGLGGSKDKTTGLQHVLTLMTKQQLDAAYRSSWLDRKIVDIVADDMTRAWRQWQADEKAIEALEETERLFKVRDKVNLAIKCARLYGGAAIFIGTADTDLMQPLNVERMGRGSLRYLNVINRHELSHTELNLNPLDPFFGQPPYYELTVANSTAIGGPVRIHPSRMVRLVGAPLLQTLELKDPWGDSILQVVRDAVDQALAGNQSVASLLQEASIDVITIPGLSELLSTQTGEAQVTRRLQAAKQIKSMVGVLALEGMEESKLGETYDQKTINMAQFSEILRLFLQVASGAADIPVTRLLGQSPAGLNATGDADIRNYYDHIAARQNNDLRPALSPLDEVMIRTTLGTRPPDIHYSFAPLWQLSEAERADIEKKRAETSIGYANAALIPPAVLERAVRNQLIESGSYPGIENAYEENDAGTLEPEIEVPEEPEEEEGELDPNSNVVRIRRTADAAPRSLYVDRPVVNAAAILAWARRVGFKSTLPAADLHVTVAFSRAPVDWFRAYTASAKVEVPEGGPRRVERFGKAVVLLFSSDDLTWRHEHLDYIGASWDHPEYQPHITISYAADDMDVEQIEPYTGPIKLGPERFAEIDLDWDTKIREV